MQKKYVWMLAAILICGASVFTSCTSDNADNPASVPTFPQPGDTWDAATGTLTVNSNPDKDGHFNSIRPEDLHHLPLIIDPDKEDDYLNEKKDTVNVYDVVEQMPNFPGGYHMMQDFIEKNLHYPKECAEKGIQGRVIIAVVVERSGKLTNIRVVKSVNPALDKEALRIVNLMPKWIPGKQCDKKVRVKYIIPITFQL